MSKPYDPAGSLGLAPLMALTSGRPEVAIGLVDGPVELDHPLLAGESVRPVTGGPAAACAWRGGAACQHGTFVAGVLSARRGAGAPALCPGCTLLVRPVFADCPQDESLPRATPEELARSIADCIAAGAHLLNLSVGVLATAGAGRRAVEEVLAHAVERGVLVVAAAGNHGGVGGSVLTRHPWVVPVVAYCGAGRPLGFSTCGSSIGRRGVGARGDAITSLACGGGLASMGGTSAATPFVTGALALLLSIFPRASPSQLRSALASDRPALVPALLDAGAAWRRLTAMGLEAQLQPENARRENHARA